MAELPRAFVVGHGGLLGHIVARVFEREGFAVCSTDRRFDGDPAGAFFAELRAARCSVIVNCAAVRLNAGREQLLLVNGLLPQLLAALSDGALLIHASSDGVFSGARGSYSLADPPDARDSYGLSKRLGERCVELGRAVVLRVSVIGPDPREPRSLLSWYLAQARSVQGYSDVRWNGITSLQWARIAVRAARGQLAPGIHQPASPNALSKAELLGEIRAAWARGVDIQAVPSGTPRDRSLRPSYRVPPIGAQLAELRRWCGS
jgi:dTDP-4-dehydrorhamnose reductase